MTSPPSSSAASGAVLYILYGSATGNSEQIAKDLAARVIVKQQQGAPTPTVSSGAFASVVCEPMQNFKKYWDAWQQSPPSLQRYHAVLLVTSTTGNGDPPENASRFIRHLKRQKATSSSATASASTLSHVAYSVLGLGDSNYDKFNETSKLVDSKLHELGATRILPIALADEGTGLEDVVEPWTLQILQRTIQFCLDNTVLANDNNHNVDNHDVDHHQPPTIENVAPTTSVTTSTPSVMSNGFNNNNNHNHDTHHDHQPLQPQLQELSKRLPPGIAPTMASRQINDNNNNTTPPASATPTPSPSSSSSPLYIMYGSATGNSEHIAKDLAASFTAMLSSANDSSSLYFSSVVCCPMDHYKKHSSILLQPPSSSPLHPKHGLIIVTSTTGNGDPPENANAFCRFLKRKTTSPTTFAHVAYAVLGLGDSNYDQFGATAKLVDRKLHELGGTRVQPVVVADEATGLEDVVEPWTKHILQMMIEAASSSSHASNNDNSLQTPPLAPTANIGSLVTSRSAPTVQPPYNTPTPALSNATTATEPTARAVEESASPSLVDKASHSSSSSSSSGVSIVRALLSQSNDSNATATRPAVLDSDLPPPGPSLSTCKWLPLPPTTGIKEDEDEFYERHRRMSDADDRMSFSTVSSSAIYYTIHRPFETTILDARYLTSSSIVDATSGTTTTALLFEEMNTISSAEETLQSLFKFYENQFPLHVPSTDMELRNGKRVIELRLSLPDDYTLEYQPGDSLGLVVDNTIHAVQFILNMLQAKHGVKSNQLVSIDGKRAISVEEVVRSQIDLCSPLKNKRVLLYLSNIATDADERAMLRLLASKTKAGEELFRLFMEEQRRTVVDVLQDFPSCQAITLDGLLSILPGIPPRYYSVSSSPLDRQHGDSGEQALSLTIAFSVVDYLTPSLRVGNDDYGRRRIGGVATRYLEAICTPWLSRHGHDKCNNVASSTCAVDEESKWLLPTTLKIFPKPSAEFRLPSNLSTPMILIGPGTGIAPFMGFLAHRLAQLSNLDSNEAASAMVEGTWRGGYELEADELPVSGRDARGLVLGADYRSHQHVGSVDVFFGCRHSDHDWLYQDEMKDYCRRGIIHELYTAFSRDDPNHRLYVQDLMRQEPTAQRLVKLILEENASVYLCGDGNEMAKGVQATLISLLAGGSSSSSVVVGNEDDAKLYLETMKSQKRFLMDIWTS